MRKKQNKDFCKEVRQGRFPKISTAFEQVYALSYRFKKNHKASDVQVKLEELRELANIVIFEPHHKTYSYQRVRSKKHPINKKCWVCKSPAFYQHHIILLKNGGYDSGINRIPICENCHKEIHEWIT